VEVEKEVAPEAQPPVNASLLEQERKRADEAEERAVAAEEAGPPPESVQITLPGAPAGGEGIGNIVVGPQPSGGPPSQRGGGPITLPSMSHPIVGRGSSTNVITLVLPSQGKGAGRPATGLKSGYVPKKKGVAFARLIDDQEREERGEMPAAAQQEKGPTTIRVTKDGVDDGDKKSD
jgi:hypothetical protein